MSAPRPSLRRQLAASVFDWHNLPCLAAVLAGGYAVGLWQWEVRQGPFLRAWVLENQTPPAGPPSLAGLLLAMAGMVAAWLLLGLLVAAVWHRALAAVLRAGAGVALLAALLPFLPVLAIPDIQTAARALTLSLTAAMGGLTYVAMHLLVTGVRKLDVPARPGISPGRGLVLAGGLATGYVLFMAVLSLARHAAFLTHAFDLGIQTQTFFTLLSQGTPLTTLYGASAVNQFGDHFSPIYYLVAPLFAVTGDARSLLVVQSLFLGLGALPVYLLVHTKSRSVVLALALASSYLLFPALHAVNTFDFHEIALVVPLLLFSLYFLEVERWGLFLIFLGLALLSKEEVALSGAAIGLYLLQGKRRYRLGGLVTLVSLVYFVLVNQVIMPALGGGPDLARFADLAAPDATGFVAIIRGILLNPWYAFAYAFLNPDKLAFLVILLLPVAFLPVLAGWAWLMAVPALAIALLAAVPSQYSLDYHYPAIMVPFVFALAAIGLARLGRWPYNRLALAAAILVLSLVMNYEYGWLWGKRFSGFPQPTPHQQAVASLLQAVPADASVSAMSDLVPHLASRQAVYLFPIVNGAEYIVFDPDPAANFWPFIDLGARTEAAQELAPYLLSNEYGLWQAADGALLLRRGHDPARNAEAVQMLFSGTFQAEALASQDMARRLPDPAAAGGLARVSPAVPPNSAEPLALVWGPYDTLLPGTYRVTYRLKALGAAPAGPLATLDVFSHAAGGALAGMDIAASDFIQPGQYQDFEVIVEIHDTLRDLEFRVLDHGRAELWVDEVRVEPAETGSGQ